MSEEKQQPQTIQFNRRATDRTPHARIDDIENDISALRERVAGLEAIVKGFNTSVDSMRAEVTLMRGDFATSMASLHQGVLGTFSRIIVGMVLVIVFSVASISALVGTSMYFSGLGVEMGNKGVITK